MRKPAISSALPAACSLSGAVEARLRRRHSRPPPTRRLVSSAPKEPRASGAALASSQCAIALAIAQASTGGGSRRTEFPGVPCRPSASTTTGCSTWQTGEACVPIEAGFTRVPATAPRAARQSSEARDAAVGGFWTGVPGDAEVGGTGSPEGLAGASRAPGRSGGLAGGSGVAVWASRAPASPGPAKDGVAASANATPADRAIRRRLSCRAPRR